MDTDKERFYKRRQIKAMYSKSGSTDQYSRQTNSDDLFLTMYSDSVVLTPPYSPNKLYEIFEESDILQACVSAYSDNIDGFGWEIIPVDGVESDLEVADKQGSPEKQLLQDFFNTPNGIESFKTIKKNIRRDFEVTGNAYIEVYRNFKKQPQLVYWMDAQRVRICPLEDKDVEYEVSLIRGGSEVKIKTKKKFRKYAMLYSMTRQNPINMKIRYFKEYGDPRSMNSLTGHYSEDRDPEEDKIWEEATEVIHYKHGSGVYGIPRWIGNIFNTLGLTKASFVNFDLFDNQGIPPLIISVAGGILSEESIEDLYKVFSSVKKADSFNKLIILEAMAGEVDLQGKSEPPKLEFKSMLDYRKDDLMFQEYIKDARLAVRQLGFRLPSLFIGDHENINYASARIIRETTEEQVFIPIRDEIDELINLTIVKDLGVRDWRFKSKSPVIRSNDELIKLLPSIIANGAFTTNELIEFSNENFGTKLKPYLGEEAEKWQANVPTPLLYGALHNFGTSTTTPGRATPENSDQQDDPASDGSQDQEPTNPDDGKGE